MAAAARLQRPPPNLPEASSGPVNVHKQSFLGCLDAPSRAIQRGRSMLPLEWKVPSAPVQPPDDAITVGIATGTVNALCSKPPWRPKLVWRLCRF